MAIRGGNPGSACCNASYLDFPTQVLAKNETTPQTGVVPDWGAWDVIRGVSMVVRLTGPSRDPSSQGRRQGRHH